MGRVLLDNAAVNDLNSAVAQSASAGLLVQNYCTQIAQQPIGIDTCVHGATTIPCGRINPSGVGVKPDTLSDSAHNHFA